MARLARVAALAIGFAMLGCDSCRYSPQISVTVKNTGSKPIKARCYVGGKEHLIVIPPGKEWKDKIDRRVDGEAWVIFED